MCTSRRRVLGFNAAARVCSGVTFLLRRFALDCGCLYVSIVAFCVWFTPVFFPFSGKKRRLAIGSVSIPPWVGIAGSAFSNVVRLSDFVGSLRVCAFICGDLDGVTGDAGNGERGWRRGLCASLRSRIGTVMLSAGSTLGLRAPNLRQRVFDSLDSLHAAAGLGWCVYAPSPGYTERPARAQFGAG